MYVGYGSLWTQKGLLSFAMECVQVDLNDRINRILKEALGY